MFDSILVLDDHCDAEPSLPGQRKEIFQENFLVVAVGIKVYDSRGVAHPGDGGRVELLVLKQVISLCQSVTESNSEL